MNATLEKSTLVAPLEVKRIQSALAKQAAAFSIQVFAQLDSTNTYLLQQAQTGASHATCVVAEVQLAGRGRRGRVWQSSPEGSLTFSLLWRFNLPMLRLEGLSLAVGVAMIRALHEMGMPEAKLKWPNDILHSFHKLAGVLIEPGSEGDNKSYAVIGIGINIQLPNEIRNEIGRAVTDWVGIMKTSVDRNAVLAGLLLHLSGVLKQFEQDGLDSLRDEWLRYHVYQNKNVRLVWPEGSEVHGRVNGIASNGALLLETSDGEKQYSVGEISLRAAE
jgi:BirA family transcriptional regulator, biotin operon repressor / biotin---[acetyl-CoA-carboxylase] ligase